MNKKPLFGTAGAGDLFYEKGFKQSQQVPEFLKTMGLTAFEYQCGRGVNIGTEKAALLGEQAKEHGITLSVHAPYYINLAVTEQERWDKNAHYFIESARAATDMGATRVVFHPGAVGKMPREEAFAMAQETLAYVMDKVNEAGYKDIIFCPETMGKINQLGNLEEILGFCQMYDSFLPCVDWGHMNARTHGEVNSYDAFAEIFMKMETALGADRAKRIHCHFSKIEYSAGGEKKHLTFADTQFGPDYEPLMKLLGDKGYTPTIICESAGTQAEDAHAMAQTYDKIHQDA